MDDVMDFFGFDTHDDSDDDLSGTFALFGIGVVSYDGALKGPRGWTGPAACLVVLASIASGAPHAFKVKSCIFYTHSNFQCT